MILNLAAGNCSEFLYLLPLCFNPFLNSDNELFLNFYYIFLDCLLTMFTNSQFNGKFKSLYFLTLFCLFIDKGIKITLERM
jgi:hypothetical protein